MVEYINLTPHRIEIRFGEDLETGGFVIDPDPDGPARVMNTPGERIPGPVPFTEGIPLYYAPQWGEIEGLPPSRPYVYYIVSSRVAERLAGMGRSDVFSPGTGPLDEPIRDANGQIVAVTRLIQAPQ